MNNRIAVVTGGTQGIGHATALALSAAGLNVGVLARTARTCTPLREIEARGGAACPGRGCQRSRRRWRRR